MLQDRSYYHQNVTDNTSLGLLDQSLDRIDGDFNLPDWDWTVPSLKTGCNYVINHMRLRTSWKTMAWVTTSIAQKQGDNTSDLLLTNRTNSTIQSQASLTMICPWLKSTAVHWGLWVSPGISLALSLPYGMNSSTTSPLKVGRSHQHILMPMWTPYGALLVISWSPRSSFSTDKRKRKLTTWQDAKAAMENIQQ